MCSIAKVVQHDRNCTMIAGWNLYRMQKFWQQLALLQLLPGADCRCMRPRNPIFPAGSFAQYFTWYAVINIPDPQLDKGSLYLYLLLRNRQLRGQMYFSTQPSGVSQWYPPIQFLWTGNMGSFCLSPTILHKCFLQGASLAFCRRSHCMVDGQDISSNIIPGAAQCHRLYSVWHCFWKGSSVNEQLRVFHPDSSLHMQQQCAVVVGIHCFKFLLANGTSPNSLYLQKLFKNIPTQSWHLPVVYIPQNTPVSLYLSAFTSSQTPKILPPVHWYLWKDHIPRNLQQ